MWYDGDGTLVKSQINEVVTYYAGRHYHLEVNGEDEIVQKFYTAGSSQVAARTLTGGQDTLTWILSDHLGSTSVTANEDGTLKSEIRYTAFGEVRYSSGTTETPYQYTGQLSQMEEIGLYYFVARFYDPATAHFASADTIVPGLGSATAWNRYAYTNYNPVNQTDPSGHKACFGPYDGDCGRQSGSLTAINKHVTQIYANYRVLVVGANWGIKQVVAVHSAMKVFEKGVEGITGTSGKQWISQNLGGTEIELGGGYSKLLRNSSYVNTNTIHLAEGFEDHTKTNWSISSVDGTYKGMIVHEFGHVLDNKMQAIPKPVVSKIKIGGDATWVGWGPGSALFQFMGGWPTGFPYWLGGIEVPGDKGEFKYVGGFGYGNNGMADYFAQNFAAAVVTPHNENAPEKAQMWMAAVINLIK